MNTLRHPLLWLVAALLCGNSAPSRTECHATQLSCEYRVDPLGIDTPRPRLSWWIESDRRGEIQTGYQIGVARSAESLRAGRFDLWDSGRVASDQSTQVEYAGKPLEAGMLCCWQVRVWDRAGVPSAWSAPSTWRMGLFTDADWRAQWIGAAEKATTLESPALHGYHALEAVDADDIKWVQIDLGEVRTLDAITLHPPTPAGFAQVAGFGFPLRFRVEASDDSAFIQRRTIVDLTKEDCANPGNTPVTFAAGGIRARHVRITATRLWNRGSGPAPYCFALAELEVMSGGVNVALHTPVSAKDSVEASGWNLARLTDGERLPEAGERRPSFPGNAAILLRKEFDAGPKILHATAFLCGLGCSELEINGQKISDHVLDPGFTDFSRRIQYVSHDVSGALRQGRNAVGVILGGGWFNLATPDLFGFERAPWSAAPRLLCSLRIDYADGTTQILASDSSWKWSTGEITFNCVRGGETIDARESRQGWSSAGFDDAVWHAALVVNRPKGRLVAEQQPPIRASASIRPVSISEPKPGVFVFDFGVNIAGWARLATHGARGTKVVLQYNERLNPDGTLDTKNLSSHTQGRFQTDEMILAGNGLESFEPRFTYHGFRYLQVSGLTEQPTLETVTGRWVTTDPARAGSFTCSDERMNRLQSAIVRTLLNNLHGIPTDCPQREKMGWMNDGCVGMEAAFYNLDTPALYRKWFDDMQDAQDANGHVPDIVPTSGWGRTTTEGSPGEMADPWWGGAIVFAPWKIYQHYGDTRVLREGFPAKRAYVDYLRSTAVQHVIEWGLGDWLDESAGGGERRVPVAQTSTAAYFACARIVAETASILGKLEDAQKYRTLADEIRAAFNRKFLDADKGLYALDSQTAQALPLALGLAPDGLRAPVLAQLVESISGARKNHISAGIVGTLPLYRALMEAGRNDLAWAMLVQEDFPGWLNMLRQDWTTIWEAWNGENSLNHPTLGCVGFWFYEALAGIRPDPDAPGFKRFLIQPSVVGALTCASATHDSMHGRMQSAWRRDGERFTLEISVPANTTASVSVPTRDAESVTESGAPASKADGVTFLRIESGRAIYSVGSGSYSFHSTLPAGTGH